MRPGKSAGDGGDGSQEILNGVSVNREMLIFRGGRIYPQSFVMRLSERHWLRPTRYAMFLLRNYGLRRRRETLPSALWAVDDHVDRNYHHWLIDCLSRLVEAETLYPDVQVLLLPEHFQSQPYVPFMLKGFPRLAVRWINPRERVSVKRLAFVPYGAPVLIGVPPQYRGDLLREVSRRVGELTGEPGDARRIYLSRADAGRRRAKNEQEVVRVLESFGVEAVQFDPAKPWEQVEASRAASLIVGIHGAALSNLIFMPAGGSVIELRRQDVPGVYSPDNYKALSETLGLGYVRQACALAEQAEGWDINHADLVVDLDELRENLAALT
jgi:capsular polysaccharide biosynthesis protein